MYRGLWQRFELETEATRSLPHAVDTSLSPRAWLSIPNFANLSPTASTTFGSASVAPKVKARGWNTDSLVADVEYDGSWLPSRLGASQHCSPRSTSPGNKRTWLKWWKLNKSDRIGSTKNGIKAVKLVAFVIYNLAKHVQHIKLCNYILTFSFGYLVGVDT